MIPNPLSVVDLSFNKSDRKRDSFMLKGALAKQGFDLWRHCFVATSRTSGKRRSFILEYYCVNPQLREDVPVFANSVDIVRIVAHQLAVRVRVKILDGQTLHTVEHILPQLAQHLGGAADATCDLTCFPRKGVYAAYFLTIYQRLGC